MLGAQVGATRVVWRHPSLRACQISSNLARGVDLAQLVGLSALLYRQGGASSVAGYGVVRTIAPAVGVPLVVRATGRLGHAQFLRLLTLLAAACTVGMVTVVAAHEPVALVLGLAALTSVSLGTYRPVTAALVPSLTGTPEELLAYNASAGFMEGATTLLGPLVAGLLVTRAGAVWALAATALFLGVGAVVAGRLPTPAVMPPASSGAAVASGFGAVFRTPGLTLLAVLAACQTFVRGALNVIVVVFAVKTLKSGSGAVGLLLGAIGAGAMLGLPVALGIAGRRRLYRSFGFGLVLWGLPIGLAATTSHLVLVLVLFPVIGLGNDLVDIGWLTALPRTVPDQLLAGVLGAFEGLVQFGMALGAIVAGILLKQFDDRVALVVVGSLLPVAALVSAPRLRRYDAGLQSRDVEVDLLRQQPLFQELSIPLLDNLAARLVPVQYAAGTVIMTEGEKGDNYVLIASGTVEIRRNDVPVAVLSSGDAFGEIALVRNTPRNATAVASDAVSARTLGRDGFLAALGCDPRVRTAAEKVADKRS